MIRRSVAWLWKSWALRLAAPLCFEVYEKDDVGAGTPCSHAMRGPRDDEAGAPAARPSPSNLRRGAAALSHVRMASGIWQPAYLATCTQQWRRKRKARCLSGAPEKAIGVTSSTIVSSSEWHKQLERESPFSEGRCCFQAAESST